MLNKIDRQNISDYSLQWTKYEKNEGYYGSSKLLQDIFGTFLQVSDLKDKNVCDIGSGTGRITKMLLENGVSHVTAIEPSEAVQPLRKNLMEYADRLTVIQDVGEAIPENGNYDYIFSMGVLDHISDPAPTVQAAYRALKPGGRMLVWIYGYEGNEFYLAIFGTLRAITKHLPHFILEPLCYLLAAAAHVYGLACKYLPLPMKTYFANHFMKLSFDNQMLTVYDQLKPAFAKYFKRDEAHDLLGRAGFAQVDLLNRHGYSWTVIGTKHD